MRFYRTRLQQQQQLHVMFSCSSHSISQVTTLSAFIRTVLPWSGSGQGQGHLCEVCVRACARHVLLGRLSANKIGWDVPSHIGGGAVRPPSSEKPARRGDDKLVLRRARTRRRRHAVIRLNGVARGCVHATPSGARRRRTTRGDQASARRPVVGPHTTSAVLWAAFSTWRHETTTTG